MANVVIKRRVDGVLEVIVAGKVEATFGGFLHSDPTTLRMRAQLYAIARVLGITFINEDDVFDKERGE